MIASPHIRLSKSAILGLGALAAMVSAPAARTQTVFDAQVPFSFSSPTLTSPRGITVAPDGTVYLADPAKGVVKITPTTGEVSGAARAAASLAATATLLAPSITIAKPTALALDSTGALYIADGTDGVVIKMATPETSSAATSITYPGTKAPTALAVDSSNSLYIADENQDAIYKVVGATATKLNLSSTVLKPVGLAVDSAGNVYFADARNNEVYKYTASRNSAAVYLNTSSAGNFQFSSNTVYPIGMGFDPAGSLYILDNDTGNLIQVISPSTSTSNIELPLSAALTPSGMAVSSIGNLYVSDDAANTADEVYYNNNPFNFGPVPATTNSPAVTVNFQFNTRERGVAIYQSMQGDIATEFHTQSTTCTGFTGTCSMAFYVDYSSALPGTRNGAVGLTDNNGEILAAPNMGIDLASALALYPGTQATLSQASQTLYEPQGLAVTGNGGTLFVADEGGVISGGSQSFTHGDVWAYKATAGTPGGTPTKVGGFPTPDALALDAYGNLYVADYSGYVSVVPVSGSAATGNSWTGFGTKLNLTGAVALNHPMALAFDPAGNLYIGDMGPSGTAASSSSPGYIIKVPANGGPATRLNYTVGGAPIVFPQALAADSQSNLYIADGGDGQSDPGGVDVVAAATGTASAVSFGSFAPLDQPSALGFDAANDLYVLDGYNQRILVLPITYTGTVPTIDTGDISLLGQGRSGLTSAIITPSNMVVWPGGQYLTVSDIGYQPQSGTPNPVQVLTLQAVNAVVDATSGSASVTGVDVGNEQITFAAPGSTGNAAFTLSGCGSSSGTTLATGIVPSCTTTIAYNGSGTSQQANVYTLNGNAGLDGSALGNQITVTAMPAIPIGVWSGGGYQSNPFGTVTLTNTGSQPLNITGYSVTPGIVGSATIINGTCTLLPSLSQNQSCTVNFTLTGLILGTAFATINVTDNNDGVVGTVQGVSVYTDPLGFTVSAAGGARVLNSLAGGIPGAGIPRNFLTTGNSSNLTTSNISHASNNSTNKKGNKKLRR